MMSKEREMMTKAEILELIAKSAREIIPGLEGHVFKESDQLSALGANSLDRAEITMMVQESLALTIPRVELSGAKNVGDLAELFLAKLKQA
ncbi:MAG TPA: acyl carrier protein [Kofleriaceae bacterium]|nr:acyl carrier protein [Kofleriaceae bacterium]